MKTYSLLCLSLFFFGCAPKQIYVSLPKTGPFKKAAPPTSFGSIPLNQQVIDIQAKLKAATKVSISPSLLQTQTSLDPLRAPLACSFIRIAPSPVIVRETELQLSLVPGSERTDGVAVNASFQKGVAEQEISLIPLWYDFRGYLMGTLTLPAITQTGQVLKIETPENREEYVMIGYLPKSQEWVGEWQRKVDRNASSHWTTLPQALLVSATDPYHSHFKATAYLICKGNSQPE